MFRIPEPKPAVETKIWVQFYLLPTRGALIICLNKRVQVTGSKVRAVEMLSAPPGEVSCSLPQPSPCPSRDTEPVSCSLQVMCSLFLPGLDLGCFMENNYIGSRKR